jgi:hypothetical protein
VQVGGVGPTPTGVMWLSILMWTVSKAPHTLSSSSSSSSIIMDSWVKRACAAQRDLAAVGWGVARAAQRPPNGEATGAFSSAADPTDDHPGAGPTDGHALAVQLRRPRSPSRRPSPTAAAPASGRIVVSNILILNTHFSLEK